MAHFILTFLAAFLIGFTLGATVERRSGNDAGAKVAPCEEPPPVPAYGSRERATV